MSVIVKHRTDMEVVAERVGLKLARPPMSPIERSPSSLEGLPARILELGEELRARASRSAPRSCSTPSRCSARSSWTAQRGLPRGARRDARQEPGGPAHLRARVRALLLPRGRDRGRARGACGEERRAASARRALPSERARGAARADRGRAARTATEGAMRDLARMAIAALRAPPGGLRRDRRRRAADPPRARPAREPQPELPAEDPRHDGLPREALRRFEALLRRELERAQIERTGNAAAGAPARASSTARCPAGPLADLAAVHRVVAQLRRRLATQGVRARGPPPPRARRRPAHDARLAADRRRAGRAQVPPAAPAAAGDLRPLRRLDERHLGLGVLPLGAARAARLVPPDALVRVHRADLRGHRHLRTRAQLQRRQRTRSPPTPASPTSPATPTTGACGRSSSRWSRTTCTRARP